MDTDTFLKNMLQTGIGFSIGFFIFDYFDSGSIAIIPSLVGGLLAGALMALYLAYKKNKGSKGNAEKD